MPRAVVLVPDGAWALHPRRDHRLSTSVLRFNKITMSKRRARDKIRVILPERIRRVGAASYQLLKRRKVADEVGPYPPTV